MYNGVLINITSDEEVGGVRCTDPMSVAPSSKLLLLLFRWWKIGQKGSQW